MKDKKVILIFRLIERLKKGVCLKDFAREYNIDERTVQRYKKDIEEIFDIKLKTLKKGCYIAPDSNSFADVLINKSDIEDLDRLIYLLMLINKKFLRYLGIEEKLLSKYLKEESFFVIKDLPFEDLKDIETFEKIKKALKHKQYLDIVYYSENECFFEKAKPIKIVFAEGNWYLAVITDDEINNGFKFLRINYIKSINLRKEEFKRDKKAEEFIKKAQSIWSLYDKKPFEVIVEVDSEVARFFKVKKFLQSQQIINTKENGNLIIKYYITSEYEIINLAKKWIPHMKIIKPYNVKEKFLSLLQEAIDKNL